MILGILGELLGRLLPSELIPIPEDVNGRQARIARRIVARNAEGSVKLAQGRYRTEERQDECFRAVRHLSF
ncbi:MAG: hypothetical protein HQL40_15485 [Alphaproteobacteria bacterium]|nr:hypothetical protein [Alphaproteobacteria bacterium]MBF0335026.1 hypothetical protein [Alphaproteobacteria bacterium]